MTQKHSKKPAFDTCVVYVLKASDRPEARYVGQTSQTPAVRLKQHLREASIVQKKDKRANWIRSVLARGASIVMEVIEPQAVWCDTEVALIARLKAAGADLVNGTAGGEGVPQLSQECRDKIAAAHRGRDRSQHSAAISAGGRRRFQDPAERSRVSMLTREAMKRPDVAAKMKAAAAVRWTEAERAAQSARLTAYSLSPVVRQSMARRMAKMTDGQVIEARLLRLAGAPLADLCSRFGIAMGPMSMLCVGKTFKYLPCSLEELRARDAEAFKRAGL